MARMVLLFSGYAGNALDSLTFLGAVRGSAGAGPFREQALSLYDFPMNLAGTYFRFVVETPPYPWGYALYRAIPAASANDWCDPDCASVREPVPEPASLLLLRTGLIGLVRVVRRKRGQTHTAWVSSGATIAVAPAMYDAVPGS
jgi:hypothetical protein